MVRFWVPLMLGAVFNGDPKKDHNFDNHPWRVTILSLIMENDMANKMETGVI